MSKKKYVFIEDEDVEFFTEFFNKTTPLVSFKIDSPLHKLILSSLDKAHDIRKFEIELYWKRATYFFAFFTVVTAAFGFLFVSSEHKVYAPGAAIAGLVIAICFYYVNLGSKYWQCNWEYIIDKLERYSTGNLYKVYFFKSENQQRPSVSNINKFLSQFIIAIWVVCLFISLINLNNIHLIFFYILSGSSIFSFTFYTCSNSVDDVITNESLDIRHYSFRKPKFNRS